MPKFFVNNKQINGNKIFINGQDFIHLKEVLRIRIGQEIEVCNEDTSENFLCLINNINETNIECDIKEKINLNTESNVKVSIFQGLPKADKMELIIQKSIELGAFDIYPVEMKRCVVKLNEKDKKKKIERWQKISYSAAKQSMRNIIPKVNDVININKLCEIINNYDIMLLAYENEKENFIKNEIENLKEKIKKENLQKLNIGIIIGPEGGLDIKEVEILKQNGAKVISLGNRILRTETASLNILSIIMYELEK